ncbi:MAG: magnesium transporter [Flavobacteriales bacterium]|jgi:magnesium transporter
MSERIKIIVSKSPGLPPGSIIYVGKKRAHDFNIDLHTYDSNSISFERLDLINFHEKLDPQKKQWINVVGVHHADKIDEFGNKLGLHPLILEDVVNTQQRPKSEEIDNTLFFSLKMLTYHEENDEVLDEQVSLLLLDNTVISFQEIQEDVFSLIRERLNKGNGRVRNSGSDYLFYALIDMIVDHYYVIMEKIGERIEEMEEIVFANPKESCLMYIQQNKKNLLALRKNIFPLREAIHRMLSQDSALIKAETKTFLSDVYDHLIQIIESIELHREMNSGLRDAYLSSLSHKMNQIMQLLTIISTIFIPLTFVAGIYGMNFEKMPELSWQYGYASVWILMSGITIGMILFFRKKKWI